MAHGGLDGDFASAHAPGEGFRAGPEGRIQPAFTGQGIDHAAVGGFRQQAQRTVQVGFAAAVGAGDQIQSAQRDHQFVDRAVVGYRERVEHVGSCGGVERRPLSATGRCLGQVFWT
ncbi:hypothetical protein D3C75_821980 [compost metagenome]